MLMSTSLHLRTLASSADVSDPSAYQCLLSSVAFHGGVTPNDKLIVCFLHVLF